MTDEEKAEEILQTKGSMTFCAKGCGYTEKVKELIVIGLSEGRKGKCFEQNNDGTIRPCEVMKDNEELKAEISVLLSCSNCSDNKGGYICEKEYNNKCLAQKIEYIKELEKENEQLKAYESHWEEIEEDSKVIAKENEQLKAQIKLIESVSDANADENVQLKKENEELRNTLQNRGYFIDWVQKAHPDIVQEYLEEPHEQR